MQLLQAVGDLRPADDDRMRPDADIPDDHGNVWRATRLQSLRLRRRTHRASRRGDPARVQTVKYREMLLDGRPHLLRYLGAWAVARSGGITMFGCLLRKEEP